MSSVVRIEYPDLSTKFTKAESFLTGDSLRINSRTDQRAIIEVQEGDSPVSITSGPLNDTIEGGLGDDTIDGGLGNDTINGGAGNDTLKIGSGDSVSTGTGADTIIFDLSQGFDSHNPPYIDDFTSEEDHLEISGEDNGNLSYDPEIKTILLDSQPLVELAGETIFNPGDLLSSEGVEIPFVTLEPEPTPEPTPEPDSGEDTTLHLLFNPEENSYFYTVDENEVKYIGENLDNYEVKETTLTCLAEDAVDPLTGATSEEVYRFYNTENGSHLYTTSEVEKEYVETLDNYTSDENMFFAYETEVKDSVAVHRFYDPIEDIHIFTHSEAETEKMQADSDTFNDEGIVFYAMPEAMA